MRGGEINNLSSRYVGFPVGHEVDSENLAESLPGGIELVENKASAVRAENFVVKINLNLVSAERRTSCSIESPPHTLSIWYLLTTDKAVV